MTVSETFTAIGDAIRRQYGTTDKYKLGDMSKMIDSLQIHNLLDDGQYYDTTKGDRGDKILNGLDLATFQKQAGKTLALSFDITWSGYKNYSVINNRTGMEYGIRFKNSPEIWLSAWLYPNSPSGSTHIYTFYNFPNDEVTGIEEGCYFNQVNSDAVVKATNFKIVVDPLGGVVPVNLLTNGHGPFLPQVDRGANSYDNYVEYTDSKVNMVYGKKYKLIAHTNGEFSNDHQPTVESNRCVLWLTNHKASYIISDSNTSTGTTFTWNHDTDTYWFRVNAYHNGTSNYIQAWDVQIYEV